jgi:hypothetical protein
MLVCHSANVLPLKVFSGFSGMSPAQTGQKIIHNGSNRDDSLKDVAYGVLSLYLHIKGPFPSTPLKYAPGISCFSVVAYNSEQTTLTTFSLAVWQVSNLQHALSKKLH